MGESFAGVAEAPPTMQRVEHKMLIVPGNDLQQIANFLGQHEKDGWEYIDHFDGQMPVPQAPPDIRGGDANGRQFGAGPVVLGQPKTMPCTALVFKRPVGDDC